MSPLAPDPAPADGMSESCTDRTPAKSTAQFRGTQRLRLAADLRTLFRSPTTWVVIATGIVARVLVLRTGFGELKADEAYTGLQAMVILDGRLPVVIDGNAYTAVIEAYIFAPLTIWFGGSVVALKSVSIAIWALAAVVMFGCARQVIGRGAAGIAAALIWLAPGALMVLSTRAYVGYPSGLLTLTATAWAGAHLLGEGPPTPRRSLVTGFLAGLTVYIHPMFITVVIPMLVVITVIHRRQLRKWWLPAAAGALAANLPFLTWNAVNGFPSLRDEPVFETTYGERLKGYFVELLPQAIGLRRAGGERFVTGDGSLLFPLPMMVVVVGGLLILGWFGVASLVRRGRQGTLILAPLILGWFLMALIGSLSFTVDGRYGIIQFPFIVLVIAAGIATVTDGSSERWGRIGGGVASSALLGAWVLVLFLPWWWEATRGERVDPNDDFAAVIELLDEHEISHVAGTYWRVLNLEYMSDRRIRAAVITHPPIVRFPDSQRLVEAQPAETVAFVFELWQDDDWRLIGPRDHYDRIIIRDMIVYLPRTTE